VLEISRKAESYHRFAPRVVGQKVTCFSDELFK
jgi:hypothetical protein